jgi:hypothetical protein
MEFTKPHEQHTTGTLPSLGFRTSAVGLGGDTLQTSLFLLASSADVIGIFEHAAVSQPVPLQLTESAADESAGGEKVNDMTCVCGRRGRK